MANKAKRQLSPEARAAAKARMEQMWEDIRAGRRPDPREAARKAREAKKVNGQVASQPTVAKVVVNPTPAPDGPRSVEPSPAIVSLFKSGSVYVLRISDMKYNTIGAAIGRALTDGTSIIVVTPTDTRMFELKPTGGSHARETTEVGKADTSVPQDIRHGSLARANHETEETDEFSDDPQAAVQRLAREAEVAARQAGARDTADLEDQINQAETPAQRRNAIKALRDAEGGQANNSICGRCRGAGEIPVALESGGVVNQACPVCRGQGSIRRYGAR